VTSRRRSGVRVNFAHTEVKGRGIVVGPPKARRVCERSVVSGGRSGPDRKHWTVREGAQVALVFTGQKGGAVRERQLLPAHEVDEDGREDGLKGLTHDLRHAGNMWAAQAGTSTKDLMARMGTTTCGAA